MTSEEWIRLLEQHAVTLRSVGVLELSVDGCSATLAPREPEPAKHDGAEAEAVDPLENPGLYPSGIVPGYTRPAEDDE